MQQDPTNITVRHGSHLRREHEQLERAPQLILELGTEAGALPIIPA